MRSRRKVAHSDEEQWGSGRYGWETLWDRSCRALIPSENPGRYLAAWSSHAACGHSQVRAYWRLRTKLFFTHTHNQGLSYAPVKHYYVCALLA